MKDLSSNSFDSFDLPASPNAKKQKEFLDSKNKLKKDVGTLGKVGRQIAVFNPSEDN